MKAKRWLSTLCITAMTAFCLAGCGGNSTEPVQNDAPAAGTAETSEPAAEENTAAPAETTAPAADTGSSEIKSTGPNGESAVLATELSLTDE